MNSNELKPGQLLVATDPFVGIIGFENAGTLVNIEPGDRFLFLEVTQLAYSHYSRGPVWRTALLLKTGVVLTSIWYGRPFMNRNQCFAKPVT